MTALEYIKGDLFQAGSGRLKPSILAHACNPFGKWSAGVACTFRSKCPQAYDLYVNHCNNNSDLLGTCFLANPHNGKPIVACLFTNDFKQRPDRIVEYTESAIRDLATQLASMNVERDADGLPVVHMPRINSGLFRVPWEHSEEVLLQCPSLAFRVYVLG